MESKFGRRGSCSLVAVAVVLALTLFFAVGPVSAKKGVTITWATIGGFYTDWAKEMVKEYQQKTGNTVKIIDIDYAQLYEKQVIEMAGGTGAYDIITFEPVWKPEFISAGWLRPLDKYIEETNPKELNLEDIAPALVELSCVWNGKIYGLPYYTWTMGYFYRLDLFDNPIEKAAFKKKYGYELGVPKTWEQMADIAQFFYRKKGQKLKGKVLDKPFYGIGLMAGRFPQIQDEICSIAWSMGGQLIKDDGTPGVLDPVFLKAVDLYVNKLLPYAPPGATSSAYDEIIAQMRQGMIAQTASYYIDLWPLMAKTEVEVPGAELAAAPSPTAHTWVGAFSLAISNDSKHPKEAWEFIKTLTGPEGQRKFVEGSRASTCRLSILNDKALYTKYRDTLGHFPVLLQILDHTYKNKFYPNKLYIEKSGKVYDEETIWYSAAASGQMPIEEAMKNLKAAIERHCGGKCEVINDHLGKDFHPTPAPFTFDESVWIRKQK